MLASGRFGPNIKRQMASMTTAWLVLGIVIGIHIGWRLHAGVVVIVSHAIAGMIVCSLFGITGSLFADR